MDDDFSRFLSGIQSKVTKVCSTYPKKRKTVIVHPTVWKDEEEAKKAAGDWSYRERASAEKELLRSFEGF